MAFSAIVFLAVVAALVPMVPGSATVTGSSKAGLTAAIELQATSTTLPLSLVYYGWHNATVDAQIMKIAPQILIDNTPGGFWNGNCDFAKFQAAGIKVFSYIDAAYSTRSLSANLALVDAIALEGTYGVFMDQVSPQVDSYLQSIYARCQLRGVKLMVNPGMPSINPSVYDYADLVMTDEHYSGRDPAPSEIGNLGKTVVIGFDAQWTATQSAAYSNSAWAHGFAYTWHEQVEYVALPSQTWLDTYISLLSVPVSPAPVNSPPVLNAIGAKSVGQGSLLQFTVSGSDPDGNTLAYTAANLPVGATFNGSTRTFSWTPATAGTYSNVTFQVSDGSLTDSEAINITVANTASAIPPVLAGNGGGGGGGVPAGPGLTNLAVYTSSEGVFNINGSAVSADGLARLAFAKGVQAQTKDGAAVTAVSITPVDIGPASTSDIRVLGPMYRFGPERAHFNPAITLTLVLDLKALPADVVMENLRIGLWNGDSWVMLDSSIEPETNAIRADVSHFSVYGVVCAAPSAPVPATPPPPIEAAASVSTIAESGTGTPGDVSSTGEALAVIPLDLKAASNPPSGGAQVVSLSLLAEVVGIAVVLIMLTAALVTMRSRKLVRKGMRIASSSPHVLRKTIVGGVGVVKRPLHETKMANVLTSVGQDVEPEAVRDLSVPAFGRDQEPRTSFARSPVQAPKPQNESDEYLVDTVVSHLCQLGRLSFGEPDPAPNKG
jgi:hypothetical protein